MHAFMILTVQALALIAGSFLYVWVARQGMGKLYRYFAGAIVIGVMVLMGFTVSHACRSCCKQNTSCHSGSGTCPAMGGGHCAGMGMSCCKSDGACPAMGGGHCAQQMGCSKSGGESCGHHGMHGGMKGHCPMMNDSLEATGQDKTEGSGDSHATGH